LNPLLISDANILIDLEVGGLIIELFSLPFEFYVPDMLFVDELEEQHSYLLDHGLQLGELSPDSMAVLEQLVQRYKQPSRYDCMALVLAKQQQCPLLTGDKNLRKAAIKEQVDVKGTLWVVGELIEKQIITCQTAQTAYNKMEAEGRRLPWDKVKAQLQAFEMPVNNQHNQD
jgi:predicted nucleic acid-binding protein